MSNAEPMKISRRIEALGATGRRYWTPRQLRRYLHKALHGTRYVPFEGEEKPGGKNRPTPRRADARAAMLARRG